MSMIHAAARGPCCRVVQATATLLNWTGSIQTAVFSAIEMSSCTAALQLRVSRCMGDIGDSRTKEKGKKRKQGVRRVDPLYDV